MSMGIGISGVVSRDCAAPHIAADTQLATILHDLRAPAKNQLILDRQSDRCQQSSTRVFFRFIKI